MIRNRLFALAVLTITPLAGIRAESTIRKSCPLARHVSIVSSLSNLQAVVCELREKYPQSPQVKNLTGDVLSTVSQMAAFGFGGDSLGSWESNLDLNEALQNLSDTLNQLNPKSNSVAVTPLSLAVRHLMQAWSNPQVRNKPSNRSAYLHDLTNVLQLTRTGSEVLNCYAQAKGPLISGEQILEFPPEQKDKGIAMSFQVVADPAKPGKYIKTIYFNTELSPISTLVMYAHELRHGCNSNNHAKFRQEAKEAPGNLSKGFQDRAVDEMRAYHTQAEFFKELAQSVPELACNEYSTSVIFGTQVISSSEYNAKLDEMFQDGTFPQYLISKYANLELLPASAVFKSGPNGSQTPELRDDLVQSLKAEGFNVRR